jgi:phosphoribosylformylglycinamidine cyclo-ligase
MTPPDHVLPTYSAAGVDEEREQSAFARVMRPWLARTAVASPMVSSITGLSSGYFATLMHLPPGPPLALTTDGVGTKILLARQAGRYEPIGIDCVANNVNDLVCVGAVPLAMLDYLATDRIDEQVLEQLARGMYLGAAEAGIAIPGGEIAQIGAMLASAAGGGPMLDLVGTAIGALPPTVPGGSMPSAIPHVARSAAPAALPAAAAAVNGPMAAPGGAWREPVDGSAVRLGDVVLGLHSSGLHSNGFSLARHVLLERAGLTLDHAVPDAGRQLGDVLLEPTRIYVRAAEALWAAGLTPHGLVHISGGGLLNLGRLAADVCYELDSLPPPPPIFALIGAAGPVPPRIMYATFNMGIGFCVVVCPADQDAAMTALRSAGEHPSVLGRVTAQPGRGVRIPAEGLAGHGDSFSAVD